MKWSILLCLWFLSSLNSTGNGTNYYDLFEDDGYYNDSRFGNFKK